MPSRGRALRDIENRAKVLAFGQRGVQFYESENRLDVELRPALSRVFRPTGRRTSIRRPVTLSTWGPEVARARPI